MSDFLYRGINAKMFDTHKGKLMPFGKYSKADLFPSEFLVPSNNLYPGYNEKNAIDKHQNPNRYNENEFKENSAYLSTTPLRERAIYYATNRYSEIGYVFTIERKKLKEYSVLEYNISNIATVITIPEDEEVLLLPSPHGSSIPEEVIISIEKINPIELPQKHNKT